jgi:hypothetical protein
MLTPKLTFRSPRLRFYHPWISSWITLPLFAVGMTVTLFAMVAVGTMPALRIEATALGVATFIGAFGVYWLATLAHFDVTVDLDQISSRTAGNRWSSLRTGSMPLRNIRSIYERMDGQILEVRGAAGEALEIPTAVKSYKSLRKLLLTMVDLYGEGARSAADDRSLAAAALIAMEYEA